MALLSFLTGIVTLLVMVVALFINLLNWVNIPLAMVGMALGASAVSRPGGSRLGKIGIAMCGTAITVGLVRWGIGCGIL